MSSARFDSFITVALMTLGFIMLCAWADWSMGFQRDCEAACAGARALTPMIGLQETCMCDEGHGRWRRLPL